MKAQHSVHPADRDEGSIIIVIIIAMVSMGLVAALLAVVLSGMQGSRSAGDSANALQVADAGINAAVQYIPTLPASISSVPANGPHDVVGGGTYTFTATKVTNQLWNVTSLGQDPSGRKRLIKAQAVAVPLFGQPVYVKSLTNYSSGSVLESYSDSANICTKKGFLTVEDPDSLKFTSGGGGTANCQKTVLGDSSWAYTIDGCRYPGSDDQLTSPLPTKSAPYGPNDDLMGPGRCPLAPNTARSTPKLNLEPNQYPTSGTVIGNKNTDYICDGSPTPATLPDYTTLQAGKTYVGKTFTIRRGCGVTGPAPIDPEKPTKVYATSIIVGTSTGSSDEYVNPPQAGFKGDPTSPSACPAYVVGQGGDVVGSTAYCKLWPSMLSLNVVVPASSTTCSSPGQPGCVYLNKQLRFFWGVISAPEGNVRTDGSGMQMWGASVSKAFSADAQFKWYFDDSLTKVIGSGRFGVANWREEPLNT